MLRVLRTALDEEERFAAVPGYCESVQQHGVRPEQRLRTLCWLNEVRNVSSPALMIIAVLCLAAFGAQVPPLRGTVSFVFAERKRFSVHTKSALAQRIRSVTPLGATDISSNTCIQVQNCRRVVLAGGTRSCSSLYF